MPMPVPVPVLGVPISLSSSVAPSLACSETSEDEDSIKEVGSAAVPIKRKAAVPIKRKLAEKKYVEVGEYEPKGAGGKTGGKWYKCGEPGCSYKSRVANHTRLTSIIST